MSELPKLPKVYAAISMPLEGMNRLRKLCQVTVREGNQDPTRQEFLDGARGMDALIVCPKTMTVDKELLDTAGKLKIITLMS